MKRILYFSFVIALFMVSHGSTQAENWPHWRGPFYNGSNTAENLPVTWSQTENIAWKTPMPGESAATPIIWGDKVFVSSLDEEAKDLLAICIDRTTGDILWQKVTGDGTGVQRRHNKASPSPVTDGKYVYFYYGTGDLVCFDFTGKKIWARNIEEDHGEFAVQFGYGSSTLLYQGKLYVLVLQRDTPIDGKPRDSYLLAIDPQTGKDLWKHIRPSDAKRESLEAYTTPIPYEGSGRKEIIIHGGDYTTGHNPATGQELWRWGTYNLRGFPHWRIVPSPVTGDGKIFVAAPKRAPLYALPGGAKGKLPYEKALWSFDDYPPDVCVPLFYQNRLFVFDGDKHVMTCLDPSNGQTMWDADLGGETVYRASPTAGDGKIYCMNEDTMVIVMDATSDTYKELGRIEMNESPSRASIAIAKNQLFIRTAQNLYCVSKQK